LTTRTVAGAAFTATTAVLVELTVCARPEDVPVAVTTLSRVGPTVVMSLSVSV
jgi:hypothetical protein